MPWQQYVADVLLEIDPETGRLAYDEFGLTVPRQSGKALDCRTELLTANRGWTSIAAVRVGDRVWHPGGYPTAVLAVSGVMHGHDCYRVTTTDGRSVVADAGHLWTVVDKRQELSRGPRHGPRVRWFESRTMTTREMYESGLSRYVAGSRTSTAGGKKYSTNEYRFVLPTQEPVKSSDVSLPIDPYVLGAWLGDGTTDSASLTVGNEDLDHMVSQVEGAGYRIVSRWRDPRSGAWRLRFNTLEGRPGGRSREPQLALWGAWAGMQPALRALGVLGNKHVPDSYLTAGAAQREALLQGLMDTDGTISGTKGHAVFCSTKRVLADGVLYLARSLGWRATLLVGRARLNGRDCGPVYHVSFTPKRTDPFVPFRMARKAGKITGTDGGKGRATLSIASIEPVASVPVRCIRVDSPDGLFLAGRDLIPTHNSTLILAKAVHRASATKFFGPRQQIVYTAQTRKDARKKWEEDYVEDLKASRTYRAKVVPHLGNGNEHLRFANRSRFGIESTTEKSGHGPTIDEAYIDEAFAQVDARMEQAFRPSMITRRNKQLGWISTAGWDDASPYLKAKVAAGRLQVQSGARRGLAYFEWSAFEDADPEDRAGWWSFMPALGHTITEEAIASELATAQREWKLNDFRRAYMNLWVPKAAAMDWMVIPRVVWESREAVPARPDAPVALSVAAAWPEAEAASIGVAGRRGGELLVQVHTHRPGTSWVVDEVVRLRDVHRPCAIVIDQGGPAGRLIADLEAAGVELVKANTADAGRAYGMFQKAVGVVGEDVPYLRHFAQPELDAAVAAAQKRPLGDAWTWARKGATDISPLEAVTLAAWGHSTRAHLMQSTDPLIAWA